MVNRRPLSLDNGQVRQVQQGDILIVNEFPEWDSTHDWSDFQPAFVDLMTRNAHYAGGYYETFNHGLSGSGLFSGGVLGPNGKIYCIPSDHDRVTVIDPDDDSVTEIGDTYNASNKWNGGTLAANGFIYATPAADNNFLKIDTTNNTTSLISAGTSNASVKWNSAVFIPNGKIYSAPVNTNTVLVLDTSDDSVNTINIGTANGAVPSIAPGPDDNVYCIPRDGTQIVKINTTNHAHTSFGSLSAGSLKWQRASLTSGGEIICAPLNSTTILVIYPENEITKLTDAPTGNLKSSGSVVGSDSFVYLVSRDYDRILRIDPRTLVYQTYGTFSGSTNWITGRLATNGFIYYIPANSSTVLKIRVGPEVPLDFALSRYINYF